ncbi:hypothetical protein [Sandaracinus amylolyticus]|uniref:hypothetical protein n=1 Tax=Sandaracinus amylolyticus TaxID=927083 RepID=UPI001F32B2C1|nr:hypothetical protein [Sandaracinus amylolyticus]UJR86420.1 Hypothetical protein I5071_85150 [Sandaracinus amylolyticus]
MRVWMIAIALSLVSIPARAQIENDDDDALAVDRGTTEASRGVGRTCVATGARPGSPVPAGYFAGLGDPARNISLELEGRVGVGPIGALRAQVRGALPITPLVALSAGIAAGASFGPNADILRAPAIDVGVVMHSPCGEWRGEASIAWMTPTAEGATPAQLDLSMRTALLMGPADDALWFPRTGGGGWRASAAFELRSDPFAGDAALVVSGGLGIRLGQAWIATWLGNQEGLTGGLAAQLFLGSAALQMRWGARADVSISSIWPGGDVFPISVDGVWGWEPIRELQIELFGGGSTIIQQVDSIRGGGRGGLRVIGFVDL